MPLYPEGNSDAQGLVGIPGQNLYKTPYSDWIFEQKNAQDQLLAHFGVNNLSSYGVDHMPLGICAAGALLYYLSYTQKNSLQHIKKLIPVSDDKYMTVDQFTQRNLELTETLRDKKKRGSLLYLLDKTKTAMGTRVLKSFVLNHLNNKKSNNKR